MVLIPIRLFTLPSPLRAAPLRLQPRLCVKAAQTLGTTTSTDGCNYLASRAVSSLNLKMLEPPTFHTFCLPIEQQKKMDVVYWVLGFRSSTWIIQNTVLTVFRWTIGHVELVNLFCIVLSLRVILSATLLSVSSQLLNELLGAVIQRQNLIGYLTRTCCLRRTGHPEFTENLSTDRLYPLFLYVIDVHSGASG